MPAQMLATTLFQDERARALFAGIAAHSVLPLTRVASSAAGLVLAAAGHTTGWPIAAGGGQSITNALASYLHSLGGRIILNADIQSLADLPSADATLFDTSVPSLIRIASTALAPAYIHELNKFRPGPGIFKLDFALSQPIPWRSPECLRAATVHLGGIARRDLPVRARRLLRPPQRPSLRPPRPAQPLRPHPRSRRQAHRLGLLPRPHRLHRRPHRRHRSPNRPLCSRLPRLHPRPPRQQRQALAAWNPNLLGGDISGGAMTLSQLLFRPTSHGYRTSNPSVYLCSSSTPPGGGVHGMCGHLAALAALRDLGPRT